MNNMRSFLIRDILSGSAGQASAGATTTTTNNSGAGGQLGSSSSGAGLQLHDLQGSSSFESLAATQARFLAKWAEHQQQQLQANKYFEQLQQSGAHQNHHQHHQHQHQNHNHNQLLNFSHLHLQNQHHQNQLQLQQQIHQQALSAALSGGPGGPLSSLSGQHLASLQQQLAGSAAAAAAAAAMANMTGNKQATTPTMLISSSSPASSTTTSAHHQINNQQVVGRKNTNNNKIKTPSFAYDCASPISSISDLGEVEAADELDEEAQKLKSKYGRHLRQSRLERRQNRLKQNSDNETERNGDQEDNFDDDNVDDDDNDDDDDDDHDDQEDEDEIEVDGDDTDASGIRLRNGDNKLVGETSRANMNMNNNNSIKDEPLDINCANSSSGGPDGCSSGHLGQQQQLPGGFQLNSPLDALFQMTSSTFDALKRGEKRKDRDGDHGSSNTFTSKQNSKKKRKSRTAFTNNQIYELERRFRMQKYLSPTDRDEIAMTLNLSNAQVITWFQNRRAKMKRDLEEQKRDIETASLLNLHKTFLESFHALNQLDKTS